MTNEKQLKSSRVASAAPFIADIHISGYVVRDVNGYIWAVCRNKDKAEVIVEAMHALAREWKPE